ncbi:MAG: hypothetical protein P4K98_05340 [Bryobacteraceae bacterium]|nr:hypothetical protein [Bryobacteraceae bacterium]
MDATSKDISLFLSLIGLAPSKAALDAAAYSDEIVRYPSSLRKDRGDAAKADSEDGVVKPLDKRKYLGCHFKRHSDFSRLKTVMESSVERCSLQW